MMLLHQTVMQFLSMMIAFESHLRIAPHILWHNVHEILSRHTDHV